MQNKNATTLSYGHTYQQMPNILNDNSDLSQNDKAVCAAIFNRYRRFGRCSYSNSHIARKLFLSVRTVARALNKLEILGFIVRKGLSFTRKFTLGLRFSLSKGIYTKPPKKEKNLPNCAKSVVSPGQQDIHNNNHCNNKYGVFSILELQQTKWYKDNPHVPVPKEWRYLFKE